MTSIPPTSKAPRLIESASWKDTLLGVAIWAGASAAVLAVAGGVLAVLLAPLFGYTLRTCVPLGAYFGGVIGMLVGSVWRTLDDVERKFVWGPAAGGIVGVGIGVLNYFVIGSNEFLPEVGITEYVTISPIAGAVAGVFTAAFKSDD